MGVFASALCTCFATAILLSAQAVVADTLPYASDAVLVLDAQNGLVTSGLNVTGWNDLSAGAHHGITNTATPPTLVTRGLNGHDLVQFSGSSSLALSGQVLATQQFTIFALVTDEATANNREIFSNWRSDNQSSSVFFGTAGTTTRKVRLTDQITDTALPLNGPTSFSVLSAVYNGGGNAQIYQDATLLTNKAVSANRILTTPYTLGVQGGYANEYWNGKMAQVIVYNRALATNEQTEVRNYLAQHWASSSTSAAVPEAMNSLTNLQVWLDAADSATVIQTAIPGSLQCWVDKSGHSYDARPLSEGAMPATGTNTLNGLNLVSFSTNGIKDRLDNLTMPALGDTNRTVIFVAPPFPTFDGEISVSLGRVDGVGTLWGITDTAVYGETTPYDKSGLTSFGNTGGSNPQIMMVSYNNTNLLRRLRNGTQVSSTTRGSNPYVTTAGYVLGGWGVSGNRPYNGTLAEVLIFDRVISEAERIIIENYLAAKWSPDTPAITLAAGSQRYAGYTVASGNYDRDVWGLGRVNTNDVLLACNTRKGLRLSASSLGDDDWLLAGHKTATNSILSSASLESGVKERWARVWFIDKTDADNSLTATLTFDFSDGGVSTGVSTNGTQYDLLYSATPSFAFKSLTRASLSSNQVAFTLTPAQLQDGYYTLGRGTGWGGGPVDLTPLVWLDAADTNTISQAGGFVSTWYDKAGGGGSAVQSDTNAQPLTGAATLNGLNLISFSTSGTADRLNNATMQALGNSSRTVIFLTTPFKTSNGDIAIGLGNASGVANSAWGMSDTTVYAISGVNDITGLTSFGNLNGSNPQIMEVFYDNTLTSGQVSRRSNGAVVTAGANRPNSGYATTNGYVVGAWADGNRPFNGNVAEVMIFDRVINAAERILLYNYLAAKWNPDTPVITLAAGSQRYAGSTVANGNYDRDVWGIGRVNSTNQLLTCNTGKGLRLSAPSLGDDDWLLAGHKTATNAVLTTGVEPSVKERWARVWYLDKTDADSSMTATLTFDFSVDHLASSGTEYDLLYSATSSFAFHSLGKAPLSDGQVSFTLAPAQLQDGYYTLGRAKRGTMICVQ